MAAAVGIIPAQASPGLHNSTHPAALQPQCYQSRRSQQPLEPFDATVLYAKLQALRPRLDDDHRHDTLGKRGASKRLSYIPRNAAQQMISTTTPMQGLGVATYQPTRTASTAQYRKPSLSSGMTASADGRPCLNPKQLHAALGVGMSESEATASAHAEYARLPRRSDSLRPRASNDSSGSQRAATSGYRPGDAAIRNAEKRKHSEGQQQLQGKLIAVRHGSQTTYERDYSPVARQHDLAPIFGINREDDFAATTTEEDSRPRFLTSADRPDWTQQSQCGDDMRNLLDRTFGSQRTKHREAARAALTVEVPGRPAMPRSGSTQSTPENLITEAVSRIQAQEKQQCKREQEMEKEREKAKKKKNILGLFRRKSG